MSIKPALKDKSLINDEFSKFMLFFFMGNNEFFLIMGKNNDQNVF